LNPANYQIVDNNNTVYTVSGAQLMGDLKTVVLNVNPLIVMDSLMTVTVNGIQDMASVPNTIETTTSTIYIYQGLVEYYAFTGISGGDMASLTNNTKFTQFKPDISRFISLIDISSWGDNYGEYVVVTYTADNRQIHIYVASDDVSEIWLSTSENPANKVLIAREESYGNQRDWASNQNGKRTTNSVTGRLYNQSADISLVANKKYYFEVKHKEGTGGDYLGVTVQKPGDAVRQLAHYQLW
jgi:hypothetical protein